SGPPPVDVPVIVSPLDGETCVANSVSGDVANVSFEFDPVENARGTGAYQVEIRRADAPTCQVAWTDVGTGFDHYPTCWIADTNTDFHADNLDADTGYRWRVRASDTNVSPPVSASWSGYQTFETEGPGC
ncbi:MAG TPA: hypothetical protein VFO41_11650, partial [Alphaproteobacteria bacterium]|nr:hypothetical protein [Alphaproteobacteria bacterium]